MKDSYTSFLIFHSNDKLRDITFLPNIHHLWMISYLSTCMMEAEGCYEKLVYVMIIIENALFKHHRRMLLPPTMNLMIHINPNNNCNISNY